MKRIVLPGTKLEVSRLGFGTASLHHALRRRDRQAILGAALDAGFTHFDTARLYGEGMAERELGRFSMGRRERLTIATKLGIPAVPLFEALPPLLYGQRALSGVGRRLLPGLWGRRRRDLSTAGAEDSLVRSLRALRTDWVDALFLHEPAAGEAPAIERLADWLLRQKMAGRVRYLGLAGQASDCIAINRRLPGLFDILQVEDSLSEREADVVTDAGRPLQITYGYIRNAQVAKAPADPLAIIQGALARNPHGMVLVTTRRRERLSALAAVAETA